MDAQLKFQDDLQDVGKEGGTTYSLVKIGGIACNKKKKKKIYPWKSFSGSNCMTQDVLELGIQVTPNLRLENCVCILDAIRWKQEVGS